MGLFSKKKNITEILMIFPTDSNGEPDKRMPKNMSEADELAIKVYTKLHELDPGYIPEFKVGLNIAPNVIEAKELVFVNTGTRRPVTCYDSKRKRFTDMEEASLVLSQALITWLLKNGTPQNKLDETMNEYHYNMIPEYGLIVAYRNYKK